MELTEGIILKTIKYQENSKLCYIITKDGLQTALVRASLDYKSKNFSYSQELTKINFAISSSKKNSFDIMTTGALVDSYLNLKKDYDTLIMVSKLMDLIYKSINHVNNYDNLYSLFSYTLDAINNNHLNNKKNVCFYPLILKIKLLYLLGLGPNFNGCTVCSSKSVYGFSIDKGGVVCKKCFGEFDYKSEYLDIMKILYLGKLEKLNNELIDELPLSSFQFIDEILNKYYDKYLSIKL